MFSMFITPFIRNILVKNSLTFHLQLHQTTSVPDFKETNLLISRLCFSVLAMCQLTENADCVIPIENQVLG